MKYVYCSDTFLTENEFKEIEYTSAKIVKKYIKDKNFDIESEVLGIWTYDLENESIVYYYVMNNEIIEMITYQSNGKPKYIININDEIYECIPEVQDCVYDNYKEAKLELLSKDKIDAAVNVEI